MRKVVLIPSLLAALLCAGLAAFIDTHTWAEWFQHPARTPMPEVTVQGATLWRLMLLAAAAVIATPLLIDRMIGHRAPEQPRAHDPARSRKRLWGLTILVIVAFGFRLTRIGESLWYDEIASWLAYGTEVRSPGVIMGNYFDPVNHVFHTLLCWISVNALVDWLGVEIAFRFPALLFSLAAMPVMFGLGRAACGERVGWLAAMLAAILPVAVLEGTEARGYSMMIFFSALASWMLFEAHRRPRLWVWIIYAVACALGIWSHFVTVFVPAGHSLWLLWRAIRHNEWRFLFCGATALGFAAILTLTLYAPMLPDMLQAKGMFFSSRGDEPTIFGAEGRHALGQLGGSWYWWAALPGLAMFVIGMVALSRKRRLNVAFITLLGLPLMALIVALSESWLYARFTFFALPGAMLLLAIGVDALWHWKRAVALTALNILLLASAADLFVRPPKQPLREAAMYVRQQRDESDRLLAIGLQHEVLKMYANDLNLAYSLHHGEDIAAKLDVHRPAWIIIEYPLHVSAATYAILHQRGYRQAREPFEGWVDWKHGDVIVMKKLTGDD